jgi:hypothetical protein
VLKLLLCGVDVVSEVMLERKELGTDLALGKVVGCVLRNFSLATDLCCCRRNTTLRVYCRRGGLTGRYTLAPPRGPLMARGLCWG